MHDELGDVAWRRGRVWLVVCAVLIGLGTAAAVVAIAFDVNGEQPAAALVAGAVGFLPGSLLALWLLVRQGAGRGGKPRTAVSPGERRELNLADGIAIATGTRPAAVFEVESPAPNVGALPVAGGYAVYFTSGATSALARQELEALCAAQIAGLIDTRVRRLHAAADRLRAGRMLSTFSAFALVPAFFIRNSFGIAMLCLVAAWTICSWALAERLRFWARAGIDAACIATTRHPQALASALPRLAAWNGPKVKVAIPWGALGAVDRFWMVPVSTGWTTTTEVNGRTVSKRTGELDEDIALLVRAALVRRVCLEGADADVTTYQDIKGHLRAAGRAAAAGQTMTVEGVEVGLAGVVDRTGTAGPSRLNSEGEIDLSQLGAGGVIDLSGVLQGMFGQHDAPGDTVAGHPAQAPPGWYPDPGAPQTAWRWWDGRSWTQHASH